MTTIAVRDGVMAADTQSTGSFHQRVKKIARLPDGSLVGTAGNTDECQKAIEWLRSDGSTARPKIPGAYLIFLRPNGSIWLAEGTFEPFRILGKFSAIGSGGAIAMGAMEAGATAAEAVRIASRHDGNTSGPFNTLAL